MTVLWSILFITFSIQSVEKFWIWSKYGIWDCDLSSQYGLKSNSGEKNIHQPIASKYSEREPECGQFECGKFGNFNMAPFF